MCTLEFSLLFTYCRKGVKSICIPSHNSTIVHYVVVLISVKFFHKTSELFRE